MSAPVLPPDAPATSSNATYRDINQPKSPSPRSLSASLATLLANAPRSFLLLLAASLARLLASPAAKTVSTLAIIIAAFHIGRAAARLGLVRPRRAVVRSVGWLAELRDRISGSKGVDRSVDGTNDPIARVEGDSGTLSAKEVSELLGDSYSIDPDPEIVKRALDPRTTSTVKPKKKRRGKEKDAATGTGEPENVADGPEAPSQTVEADRAPEPKPEEAPKDDYQMALLVRTDLGMGKGKAAAQACLPCLHFDFSD